MSRHIQSAIANVDKLLAAGTSRLPKKPMSVSSATKMNAAMAKKTKILAMLGVGSKPNLRLLNKLIGRGVITAEEVVNAVGEALFLKRVNKRIVEAIVTALQEALVGGDVIDVEEAA